MKFRLLCILVICLMTSGAYATNHATASGNWTDASVWSATYGSPVNNPNFEEIKIGSATGLTLTVNGDIGAYSTQKIGVSSDNTLAVAAGASLTSGRELNVGNGPGYGAGLSDVGYLTQTGGQIEINRSGKLNLAYRSSGLATTAGFYSISGGTLYSGVSTTQIVVGASSGDGMTGRFRVIGTGGTINFGGSMYIANSSSTASAHTGTGILDFVLNADGEVSPIKVLSSIIDSQGGLESAIAKLNVDAAAGTPTADVLLLVQNTGTSSVVGHFTSLEEGTYMNVGGRMMMLTYLYDADGDSQNNDIALVPEPATIALLSLGLLVIRRKK